MKHATFQTIVVMIVLVVAFYVVQHLTSEVINIVMNVLP